MPEPIVPPLFYKYVPIDFAWLPNLLLGESLLFSARASFNDPLDSRPAYQLNLKSIAGSEFTKSKLRNAGMPPAQRVLAMSHLKRQAHKPRAFSFVANGADPLDDMGILSLSDTWKNMLLWSHYADMHVGACVAFYSDKDIFQIANPVHYSESLPTIYRPDDDPNTMLKKAFYTKAQCWAYEREWRIVQRRLTNREQAARREELSRTLSPGEAEIFSREKGPGIYRFNPNAIESITLGCKVANEIQRKILTLTKEVAPHVTVYRIDLPKVSFDLTRSMLRPGR